MSSSLETYYVGTDLKVLVELTAIGFDQATDDYEIKVTCNGRSLKIYKEEVVDDGDGNYYVLVDTSRFGSGLVRMIVTAYIPDSDFPYGVRKERATQNICYVKKTRK